ncbi:uncharacterized protein LOC132704368 [Cylas formicarius]|uniref:uncharacterized protein LOC132704368 n=1 Tax=Cylas formicarius TaxID=197179 RepID=UPI00295848CB|nr:uncharacterized protein LOC132704368 [Cylas formicarius]
MRFIVKIFCMVTLCVFCLSNELPYSKNNARELADIFFKNLKFDPYIEEDNGELTENNKNYINRNVKLFVDIITERQGVAFSRSKRSSIRGALQNKELITVVPIAYIPTKLLDDIKFLSDIEDWIYVGLHHEQDLLIFRNETVLIRENLSHYTSDLSIIESKGFTLLAVGTDQAVNVFELILKERNLRNVQSLNIANASQVQLWECNEDLYLFVTWSSDWEHVLKKSTVTIYKWLGKHFDLVQSITSSNVAKSIPFSIHGQQFLVLLRSELHTDELESYSHIYKFDPDEMKYVLFQRIFTPNSKNLRYFTSTINGKPEHFFVIDNVDITENDFSEPSVGPVIYKYVEIHFIPFQRLEIRDLVSNMQPVQDIEGNTVLLFFTKTGFKGFQYDGWNFSEALVQVDTASTGFETNIRAIHIERVQGQDAIVLLCDSCDGLANVFRVNFISRDMMESVYSDLQSWCTARLKEIESRDEIEIVGESLRGDLNEEINLEEDAVDQIIAELKNLNETLTNLEQSIGFSSSENGDFKFKKAVDTIVFNRSAIINSLHTEYINDESAGGVVDSILSIKDGFEINAPLTFDFLLVENEFRSKLINNKSESEFIRANDDLDLRNLKVGGFVTFQNDVNILDNINNFSINMSNILLSEGDQELFNLNTNDVAILSLKCQYLNKLRFADISSRFNETRSKLKELDEVVANNVDIGGLMNEVSLEILRDQTLKKVGDQRIEKTWYFDLLTTEELTVNGRISSQKFPEDMVLINGEEYVINQDVNFEHELKVNKLEVLNSLNDIPVNDNGELEILLKDSNQRQYIRGAVSIENLLIANPILLRSKIKNDRFLNKSPLIMDAGDHVIDDDLEIIGGAKIKGILQANDLTAIKTERSVVEAFESAVKITDKLINITLNFTEGVCLDQTFAERVNGIDPRDWLLRESNVSQVIRGRKRFVNDLKLNGVVIVEIMNDVDTTVLEKNALKITGDQDINAEMEIPLVAAENGTESNVLNFGSNPWKNLAKHSQREITHKTISGNLSLNLLQANNTEIKGSINNQFDLLRSINDITRKGTNFKVFGEKRFDTLHIKELSYNFEQCIGRMLKAISEKKIDIDGPVSFYKDIEISNINFEGLCNGLRDDQFEHIAKMDESDCVINEDMRYDNVFVDGEVTIQDNEISGVNITRIYHDTVKIDESFHFKNAVFGKDVIIENDLLVEGNVDNLDITNIFEQNSTTPVTLADKTFEQDVFVENTLSIESVSKKLNFATLCDVWQQDSNIRSLYVNGNIVIVKGQQINRINGYSIDDLADKIWFSDEAGELKGNLNFDNTTFRNTINVTGLVDDIAINLLAKNYLSLSKEQTILSNLVFENDVVFSGNVSTPEIFLEGTINNVHLRDAIANILLDHVDQVFESVVYLEECDVIAIENVTNYLVNGLNVQFDVMRYDTENIVTGRKLVENVVTEFSNVSDGVKIQNVDIIHWLNNSVLSDGSFRITGNKVLGNASFKNGLSVRGKVNNEIFTKNSVMLTNLTQTIAGAKTFIGIAPQFKTLKSKASVNGIDLGELAKSQLRINGDNTIKTPIEFFGKISARNLNIIELNDGINVMNLLKDTTKLKSLNNIVESYNDLLNMAEGMQKSLKDQAYFLKYYKEVMHFSNAYEAFGIQNEHGIINLVLFFNINSTNVYRVFQLEDYTNTFVFIGENTESYSIPNYMQHVLINGNEYLYIEHMEQLPIFEYSAYSFLGKLVRLTDYAKFEEIQIFPTNGTICLTTIRLPKLEQECLIFVDQQRLKVDILCDESGNQNYYLFQTILLEQVDKVSSVVVYDTAYIIASCGATNAQEGGLKIFAMGKLDQRFQLVQSIFDGAEAVGVDATFFGDQALMGVAFRSHESAVNLGRLSIRRLDEHQNQFVPWQYFPMTSPLAVNFLKPIKNEPPLLIVPSLDANVPLLGIRYGGLSGFQESFRSPGLPAGLLFRKVGDKFILTLNRENGDVTVMMAVFGGRRIT